jgi:hypothetical protein
MLCEKCGAATADDAVTCPECGEPLGAPVAAPSQDPVPAMTTAPGSKRPAWLVPLVAVLALALIGAGAYFLWLKPAGATATGPAGAAQRMMEAFGTYDAQGILDNATHASMSTTDVAAFTKQAEAAKKTANGKAGLKDLKILKTTYDPSDKNTAVIQLSAQWLTDPVKGTYTQRTETVTVLLRDGKWLVKLF